MLLLVLADRDMGGAIGQDVGRHQDRIGVEADRSVLAVLAGLVLELGHAVEPAEAGDAVEDPGELGMGRHLALVEHDRPLRVDAGREEGGGDLADLRLQLGRILPERDRVQIDDAVEALRLAGLHLHEPLHGAEIIAEMQVPGRLHAGEDQIVERGHRACPRAFVRRESKPRGCPFRTRRGRRFLDRSSGRVKVKPPMRRTPALRLHCTLRYGRRMWTRLAHPGHFLRWTAPLMPWLAGLSGLLLAAGLYLTWFVVPPDYQQGETVRIMYIHVPAAWLGVFFYGSMSLSAIGTLVWRHPLADVAQRAAAPIGAAFTIICLVTGSLWGKPMWGTYWVWDARLTSMLVLFLIYCGIIALWRTIEDPNRAARAIAILTLVGAVNLPIIKFSVNWWSTLHQPASILRMGGSSIDPSMLYPLLLMILAFTLLGITLHLYAMRTEILRRRVRVLTIREAERLDAGSVGRGAVPPGGPAMQGL